MKLRVLFKVTALCLAVLIIGSFSSCKTENTPSEPAGSGVSSDIEGENSIEKKDIGNTVSYAVSSFPQALDPSLLVSSSIGAQLVYHISDGLLRMYDNKVVEGIAESYETQDNITFVFKLREAYWEDAVRITAEDFYYVFRRILDKNNKGAIPEELLMIKNAIAYRAGNVGADELGIKVVDKNTFEITLEEANPIFIEMLAADTQTYLVRKDIIYACGDSFAKSAGTYLSSGPFRLKSWSEDEIIFEKNPMYWDSQNVSVDSIRCLLVQDGATRAVLYEAGECNAYAEMLSTNRNKYPDSSIMKENTLVSLQLNFDNSLLNNTNFRKAISCAIDRTTLASELSAVSSVASGRFVPNGFFEGVENYDVSFEPSPFVDTVKANEYLASALQELETTVDNLPELVFVSSNSASSKMIAEEIVSMLRENLGLTNIRVAYVSSEKAVEYYCSGNYDIYVLINTAPCMSPAWQIIRWKTNSIYNLSGWSSETFDGYFSGSSDYSANLKEGEELLINSAPEIPLYYRGFAYGFADNVSGIGVSSVGVKLQFQYAKVSELAE